jgi:hypothetical protein
MGETVRQVALMTDPFLVVLVSKLLQKTCPPLSFFTIICVDLRLNGLQSLVSSVENAQVLHLLRKRSARASSASEKLLQQRYHSTVDEEIAVEPWHLSHISKTLGTERTCRHHAQDIYLGIQGPHALLKSDTSKPIGNVRGVDPMCSRAQDAGCDAARRARVHWRRRTNRPVLLRRAAVRGLLGEGPGNWMCRSTCTRRALCQEP